MKRCSVTRTVAVASCTETPPSALRAATCSCMEPAGSFTPVMDVRFSVKSASSTASAFTPLSPSTTYVKLYCSAPSAPK